MSRFIGAVLIYGGMLAGWVGVGLFLVFAPARFGNLVHESLSLFPKVDRSDWGKKLFLRLFGLFLIGFAIQFVSRIVSTVR